MSDRAARLYNTFIESYDDIDDVHELFEALIMDCPEAEDQEMIDFVMEVVIENNDEVPHLDDAVADFCSSFGRKV